jgi:hypothetical protein
MPTIPDEYTDSFTSIWGAFRAEVLPEQASDPFLREEGWGVKGPTETLEELWSQRDPNRELGPRGREVLSRVRNWLRGAEQSAVRDRDAVEALLDRCALDPELRGWRELRPPEREQVIDRLLRTVAALSATIRNERPREGGESEFRIDWQEDGDGLGRWESAPPTRAFSLAAAVRDLAGLHGHFSGGEREGATRHIVHDLRGGDLVLPLLVRSTRSSAQTAWLRRLAPGRSTDDGLLLPERRPAVRDELALWQIAPGIARIFDEALVLAARANVENPEAEWGRVEAKVDVADELDTMRIAELCTELRHGMAMPLRSACTFLAAPLFVISQRSKDASLRRRARSSLAVLQELVK